MEYQYSICDYFEYIRGTDNSRVVYEGEQVLHANHIILCGTTCITNSRIDIYALCLQTSALQAQPHILKGTFDIESNKCRILNFNCSCEAGKSERCKHISAVLLLCTRTPLNKLEMLSQTDISCAWSNQKGMVQEMYQAISIKEMPCLKKCKESVISKDVLEKIKSNFVAALPKSASALHASGRRQITLERNNTDDTSFNMVMLNVACQSTLMMMLSHHKVDFMHPCCEKLLNEFTTNPEDILRRTRDSKREWSFERKHRITGSRIYEIYTYKGQDWIKKSKNYFSPKVFTNKYTRHGIEQEAVARETFQNVTGLNVVECGFVVSQFNSWLGYSPDGLILNNNSCPEQLLEIKCPYEGRVESIGVVLKKAKERGWQHTTQGEKFVHIE